MFINRWNRPDINEIIVISQEHVGIIIASDKYQGIICRIVIIWNQIAWWVDCKVTGWKQSYGAVGFEQNRNGRWVKKNVLKLINDYYYHTVVNVNWNQ